MEQQQQMTEEQMKALQEKISKMSPEELREFQKKQCVFCQIISGKIQAKKIYEDDKVVAALDINPANPGHVLVLSREHYSIMPQIPDDDLGHLFVVVKSLSNSMLRSIDAHGTNIIVANGVAAGQRAQHFMAHLIPRRENDGINFILPQKAMEQPEIESIGDRIIASLKGVPQKQQIPAQARAGHTPLKSSAPAKSAPAHEEKKPEAAKSGIDLDDIARFLGGK